MQLSISHYFALKAVVIYGMWQRKIKETDYEPEFFFNNRVYVSVEGLLADGGNFIFLKANINPRTKYANLLEH